MTRTPLETLLEEVRRLGVAAHDARVERLERAGLTALDRRLLDLLDSAERPVSPGRLARPLLCPASAIEDRLHTLQRRAWVTRVTGLGRQAVAFELRPAGRRALEQLREAEGRLEAALDCALDAEALRAATSLLQSVRARLRSRQGRRRPRERRAVEARDFDRPVRATGSAASSGAWLGLTGAAEP